MEQITDGHKKSVSGLTPEEKREKYGKRVNKATKLSIKAQAEMAKKTGNESLEDICRQYGITRTTLTRILTDDSLITFNQRQLSSLKGKLISRAYSNSMLAQTHVTPAKLQKSSFVQLMVGSKIAMEMGRLLEDKSTANIAHAGVTVEAGDEIQKIKQKLSDFYGDPS